MCDYHGTCRNPAFMEVDWDDKDGNRHWSWLCLPHFILEYFIYKKSLGYCLAGVWHSHFINCLWKVFCKIW